MSIQKLARMNVPSNVRKRIKIAAAMCDLSMIDFIEKLVTDYEKARGSSRQAQSPGTTTVKEAT